MDEDVINGLVADWDDVYKKGQLGFWILLSIYDGRKYTAEIIDFMNTATSGHFEVKEQSLYRALRRFHSMQLVDITEQPSPNSGPMRKYYELSSLGRIVLGRFITLHIMPLTQPSVNKLITRAAKEATNEKSN